MACAIRAWQFAVKKSILPNRVQHCLLILRSESIQLTPNATITNCTTEITDISGLDDLFGTDAYSSHRIPEVRQLLIYCHAVFIFCGIAFNLAIIFGSRFSPTLPIYLFSLWLHPTSYSAAYQCQSNFTTALMKVAVWIRLNAILYLLASGF